MNYANKQQQTHIHLITCKAQIFFNFILFQFLKQKTTTNTQLFVYFPNAFLHSPTNTLLMLSKAEMSILIFVLVCCWRVTFYLAKCIWAFSSEFLLIANWITLKWSGIRTPQMDVAVKKVKRKKYKLRGSSQQQANWMLSKYLLHLLLHHKYCVTWKKLFKNLTKTIRHTWVDSKLVYQAMAAKCLPNIRNFLRWQIEWRKLVCGESLMEWKGIKSKI